MCPSSAQRSLYVSLIGVRAMGIASCVGKAMGELPKGASYDLTLTEGPEGVLAHRPSCPEVERHRVEGRPICTMIACTGVLPKNIKRHKCLDENVSDPVSLKGG